MSFKLDRASYIMPIDYSSIFFAVEVSILDSVNVPNKYF